MSSRGHASVYVNVCGILLALCAPVVVSADVVINEFLYDAPATDTDQEFVEIYNSGNRPVDLTKWKLSDGSSHVLNVPPKNGGTGSIVLGPGGYALLVNNAATFIAAHSGVNGSVIDTVLSLPNTGGTISLINASGTIASSVHYTKTQGGAGDGNSLQKNDDAWIAALPTMNAPNATKAAPVAVASAAPKKAPATQSKRSSTVATTDTEAAPTPDQPAPAVHTSSSTQIAAAADSNIGSGYWWLGALVIAAAFGAAAIFVKTKKKDEWDIVEESPEAE